MQYTVNHNGANCILPAFTRGVKQKIDDVNSKISDVNVPLDNRIDAIHGFLVETVGEELLTRVLGSSDADEIDLNEMNILYLKITKEYDRPVNDFNKPEFDANTKKLFQEITGMAKSMESIQRSAAQAEMMKK